MKIQRLGVLMAISLILGGSLRMAMLEAADPAALLITEIMVNPAGEDQFEEWIEIANVGPIDLDISNFALGDEETVGQNEGMLRFPPGTIAAAGQVLVIAQDGPTFAQRHGFTPDFEFKDGDPAVVNLIPAVDLAQGEVGLANGGDEVLLLDPEGDLVDGMSYGDSARILRPPAPAVGRNVSLQRFPANCDSDSAVDWQPGEPPNPGVIQTDPVCNPPEVSTAVQPIGLIQGSGPASAFVGQEVTVQGVVIGRQADRNVSGVLFHTIYLQNSADLADGQAETSDGLPVFLGTDQPTVRIGDEIQVSGVITEFFGLTEVGNRGLTVQTISRDNPLPEAVELTLSPEGTVPSESLEGMHVFVGDALVVGPKFATEGGCGFAVTTVQSGLTRLIRHDPEAQTAAILPIMHVNEADCEQLPEVKVGDRLSGLAGPLTYNFDLFRLVNQDPDGLVLDPAALPEIPPFPRLEAGQISLTSTNVENLFDEIDDTGDDAEPKFSPEEIAIKLEKLAFMLGQTLGCPTIIGIQEVEKRTLLDDLSGRLESYCGIRYEVIHEESLDGRGIDVAMLSDPQRIEIEEVALRPECVNFDTSVSRGSCPAGQSPLFSRPPLVVRLTIDGQHQLVVMVNHFKSKRGGEAETQPEREAQARFVIELVDEYRQTGIDQLVVMGDFNDYADSRPLRMLTEEGKLENVLRRAPAEEQYSFNFGGVSQLIDGILLSEPLSSRVDAVQLFHINADFPDAWSNETGEALFPFKSSDHDPAVVVLDFSPQIDADSPSPPTPQNPSPITQNPSSTSLASSPDSSLPIWVIIVAIFTVVLVGGAYIWRRVR
ncbi:MAG: lamin tail domain-containing protein [Ardenticatenaceae bacterium]|nr:lamin tail domain-containing protein [Ardenticatenaceae bacterium]